jgi:Tol biopolymer transport system component
LLVAFWAAIEGTSGAQRIAYTRLDNGHWQVWMANADGANPHRITASPWDKRCLRVGGTNALLLRDNEGKLHRLVLAGGARETPLPLDFEVIKDFDFNPRAGFLIASYAPNALDNVCIWQVTEEGQRKRLLIPDPYLNETPRWIAGSNQFLFAKSHAGQSHLYVSEIAQPKPLPFLRGGPLSSSDPCPSPDGAQVAFCGQGRTSIDLWICSSSGSDVHELYSGPGLEAEPGWSPDGAWVYFATWDGKSFRLARIRPTGKEFGLLSEQGVDCRCPLVITVTGENHE